MAHFTPEFRYVTKEGADRWCAVLHVKGGAEPFSTFFTRQECEEYCADANEMLRDLHFDREAEEASCENS